ncbi:MAG: hypothetical protein H0U95_03995 [Bacteroidetes bacterium]|nr:hypothetical protein [Bacteroidota bacterium]
MRCFLATITALLFLQISFAQTDTLKKHKIDSLTLKLEQDSIHTFRFKKLRPYVNIDSQSSFKSSNHTIMGVYQAGVIVNEYHTFGLGFYNLTNFSKNNTSIDALYKVKQFSFVNIFYEYFLMNKRFLEIDTPFEIGVGGFQAQVNDSASNGINISKLFVPLGAGVKFIVKPVRWIGLSSMIGYRYIPYKQNILGYAGFFYSFGVWIDFRQIYRDIKYYGVQKKRYRRSVNSILAN